ncbi:glucose dehydrogenase [FAD, quinone]-like, partial [Chrysoperla carnea]|uniref:glucose dehydrogenase [FAD, quinone]-like n=1 Tax=Chrysoperla carnea TaxID=189513 RepID=UPI001D08DD01
NEPADTRDIDPEYDFIIVGAGTAGCALAARLSELKDNTVLLIEAGGPEEFMMDIPMMAPNLQGSPADWAYMSEPDGRCCTGQPGGRCFYPRGKVMGGSSVLNFMIYSRGHKKDYDRWAEAGCKGWSYKEVLPYFKKLENFKIDEYFDPEENGKGGPVHVELSPYETPIAKEISKGFLNLGYKYGNVNKADNKGFSRMPATLKHGTRHSSSRAYLHPIANKRPNLHVKKNSLVTKILINKKTKTAYGVQFLNNGITRRVLARKEVIVSGGAMNSPQLLMLSGIGPAHHLRSLGIPVIQNSSVGYNLQDHIALGGLIFVTEGSSTTTPLDLIRNDTIITEYFNHHTGPLSVPGGCEVIGLIDPDKDGIPKVELLVVSQQIMMNFFLNTPIAAFLEPYLATSIWLCLPMVLKPYSRGRIKLKSKNPLDYPLIEPNYFADERDLATMVQAGRRMLEINDSPVMKRIKSRLLRLPLPACEPFPIRSDEYLACLSREMTFNIYHQSGTCRMGPASDPTSVVDPRLRVIGVKNLRVIDVSIMHEIPSGHTNGPTYMVAEKGADMIKEDWGYPIPRNGNWAYNPIDEHKT